MYYLVTYDLNKSGQNYDGLISAIKKYPYCKALYSAWFIKSSSSADSISADLSKHIDSNDNLLVLEVTSNRQGYLNKDAWAFLSS